MKHKTHLQNTLVGVLVAGVGGVTALFSSPVGTLIAVVGTAIIVKYGLSEDK